MNDPNAPVLRLALPKGRMQQGIATLLADAGLALPLRDRDYRPRLAVDGFQVKLLKPQNVVEMLHAGSRDLGFAGADWVRELRAEVVELLDTGLDPVRLVAAAPRALLIDGKLPARQLVVASEYENVTRDWLQQRRVQATFVRSYGATEVFPPEDADVIVDNTATGDTLAQNGLQIVEELGHSSTRLYANPHSLRDPLRKSRIDAFAMLVQSVLDARKRVLLDLNVGKDQLDAVVAVLPSMQCPTISTLHGGEGYAVRAAVPRAQLPVLIPLLRARGARDLVVQALAQIVA